MKTKPIPELSKADIQRFWGKVAIDEPTLCWYWHGWVDSSGYANFDVTGKKYKASRLAYFLLRGLDLGDLHACHTCDDPECVNPFHIWPGDDAANARDMALKGRATRGERNPRCKLTEGQVRAIRQSSAKGCDLAHQYNVSVALVSLIRSRKIWRHLDG